MAAFPKDAILPTCLNGVRLTFRVEGQVDQLEDRYLGMVEASGSNPDLSISSVLWQSIFLDVFLNVFFIVFLIVFLRRLPGLAREQNVFYLRMGIALGTDREGKMYEMIWMLTMAFLTGLTGALAPGPTLVATINSSLKYGWTAGPKIAAGHALVEIVIFLSIVGGANVAMQQHFRSVHVVGGLALIAFGILTVKGCKSATMAVREEKAIGNPYMAGMITSGANPYFWFWWLTVGSAMVLSGLQIGLIMAAILMICHWGADFGWYLLVSTSLDRGRSILSEKNYRRILGLCGGFLVCFGLYYLVTA